MLIWISVLFQWQQTEDFSRKKEIRAHMYRLREERLRSLYSPEPGLDAKGAAMQSLYDFHLLIHIIYKNHII